MPVQTVRRHCLPVTVLSLLPMSCQRRAKTQPHKPPGDAVACDKFEEAGPIGERGSRGILHATQRLREKRSAQPVHVANPRSRSAQRFHPFPVKLVRLLAAFPGSSQVFVIGYLQGGPGRLERHCSGPSKRPSDSRRERAITKTRSHSGAQPGASRCGDSPKRHPRTDHTAPLSGTGPPPSMKAVRRRNGPRTVNQVGPEVRPSPRWIRPEALSKTRREAGNRRHTPRATNHKHL